MRIVCDICRQLTIQACDGQQPICAACLRGRRIRAGIEVEPIVEVPVDMLPIAAHIEYGPLPAYPTRNQVQLAGIQAHESPVARWRFDAIRSRFA
jgi:hypothetical protein